MVMTFEFYGYHAGAPPAQQRHGFQPLYSADDVVAQHQLAAVAAALKLLYRGDVHVAHRQLFDAFEVELSAASLFKVSQFSAGRGGGGTPLSSWPKCGCLSWCGGRRVVGEGKWGCSEDSRDTNDYGRMNQPFNGCCIITWHLHLAAAAISAAAATQICWRASPTHLLQLFGFKK